MKIFGFGIMLLRNLKNKPMKVRILSTLILLTLSSFVYSWEKVPIPDYVDNKTKSPWNFIETYEELEVGRLKLCVLPWQKKCVKNLFLNDKGAGTKPFIIKNEENGNKYLEVTVKHGWNDDPKKRRGKETERAEFQTYPKRTINDIIWIGFRVRIPDGFTHIDDRVLFFQFKNQFKGRGVSPLLGLTFYNDGNLFFVGGHTGSKSLNYRKIEKNRAYVKYYKKGDKWWLRGGKIRGEEEEKYFDQILTNNKSFGVTKANHWSTFKIGVKNSRKNNGFVKVYKDDVLIFNYKGITYDWSGEYKGSYARIGLYRDSGKRIGTKYPDQTIHFDDFSIVSDKETLDNLLEKNN